MSEYTRIENMQDEDQVYTEIVKIFGKDTTPVFLSIWQRRCLLAGIRLWIFQAN